MVARGWGGREMDAKETSGGDGNVHYLELSLNMYHLLYINHISVKLEGKMLCMGKGKFLKVLKNIKNK